MNLLYTILYSGHHFVKSSSGKRGVVLSNALGAILFAVGVILSIPYYFTYGWNFVTAVAFCWRPHCLDIRLARTVGVIRKAVNSPTAEENTGT